MKHYTKQTLQLLPTIQQGYTADLKVATTRTRVWLGQSHITIEKKRIGKRTRFTKNCTSNQWEIVKQYEA